jgi:hypothetical protein
MEFPARRLVTVLTFAILSAPALADECSSAMLASAQKPVSMQATETDAHGKQKQMRMVQTANTVYILDENGQWKSMSATLKEKYDATVGELKTSKTTCQRVGSDSVNGASTTVYAVHVDNEGSISDNKIWVAANQLVLKSDSLIEGTRYVSVYDYAHLTPPANATPVGPK